MNNKIAANPTKVLILRALFFLMFLGAITGGMLLPLQLQAAEVKLKVSHFLPSRHGFQVDLLEPFAEALKEKAGVDVTIFDASTSFGKITQQADQVRAGVIDIAIGLRGIPRGRYLSSSIVELPFLVEDADSGSKVLWDLYKEGMLGSEYDDFKVLALFTHNGGLIHTREKPVKALEDLKSLRLRTPSAAVSAMLKSQGATAVGMPPSNIYEFLEKGVLDGLVTTWDLVGAIKANENLKYHTDARTYVASFYIVMNKKKYNNLPENVRVAIDELTGDNLVSQMGGFWNKWDARGREDAKKRGNEIIPVSDELRTQWKASLQPMISAYLDDMKEQGVKDPHALYKRAQELANKYESK